MKRRLPMVEPLEARLLFANIAIDANVQHQTIDGFGTSLSWWMNNPYDTAAWQNMYYDDLGASMLRSEMRTTALEGSDGDWKTPVTLGTDLAANVALFDFNRQGVRIAGQVAQQGVARLGSDFKLTMSIWSPPHWMKGPERNPSSGAYVDTDPNTAGIQYKNPIYVGDETAQGTLLDTDANYTQFGRYVASYVAGFEQTYGVQIDAISLQNELQLSTASYGSCVYTPAIYVKALKAVDAAMQSWGLDTRILGPEHQSMGNTGDPWQWWQARKFIDAVKADPIANAALDIYATHNYKAGSATDGRSPQIWDQIWNGRPSPNNPTWPALKLDGKPLWMTEVSEEAPTWSGAMVLAAETQEALSFGNVSAWLYWQTSTQSTTGGSFTLTGNGSGADDTIEPKYVAQKHFYKYIRPGAIRVSATPNDTAAVEISSYLHDADETLTTVLVNRSTSAQPVTLNLAGLSMSSFNIFRQSTDALKWQDMSALPISGGVATFTMPANSIVTLQGSTAATGSIAGSVYNDQNDNGSKTTGEPNLASIRVFDDVDRDGAFDAGEPSALTTSTGTYTISGLAAGTHRIRPVVASGWRVSQPIVNGYIDQTLTAGQVVTGKVFGLTSTARIDGFVYRDVDNSGTFSGGDTRIPGVTLWLDLDLDGAADAGEPTRTSDSSGNFSFRALTAGTYRLRAVTPGGYTLVAPSTGYHTVTVASGQAISNRQFGMRQNAGLMFANGRAMMEGLTFRSLFASKLTDKLDDEWKWLE